MPAKTDFPPVFEELKKILQPFAPKLTVKADTADMYHLDGPYSEKWKKELYFASTHIKKNYVSFYLMPVYMYPDLLDGISPKRVFLNSFLDTGYADITDFRGKNLEKIRV